MVSLQYTPELAADWKKSYELAKGYLSNRISVSMNESQLISKMWLAEEMLNANLKPRYVGLLGGWFAQYTLPLLFDNFNTINDIINYEMDPDTKSISYKFNKRYKEAKKYRVDIKNVMFTNVHPLHDLIINTSCEHMFPMKKFREINSVKDKGRTYVLQSTNEDQYEDHINCVQNEDELADQANFVNIIYSGHKILPNGIKRFMVIGN